MIFNVQNFGAKGDGVSDDTAAIQQAIDAAAAAGGGQVYVPPGPTSCQAERNLRTVASCSRATSTCTATAWASRTSRWPTVRIPKSPASSVPPMAKKPTTSA
ncbi:glycosyl hydrolase family 28-related protein [Pseudomonas sp. 15A4]|uniref:glycosyl hydrolase family 28-related protein n=1 Tax=Pseudomonas sp. 15A4 TaxID=2804761 RepID=UPI0023DDBBA3|nr:glycosyl hydrolase family 28-related protein [Pseudomonas sp. 15A4]